MGRSIDVKPSALGPGLGRVAMLARCTSPVLLSVLSVFTALTVFNGCKAGPVEDPEQPASPDQRAPPDQPEAEVVRAPIEPNAQFVLERDGETSPQTFGADGLVFCRWYAEAERGDYVWVRLARDPGDDGDAGPRLDIDLCRVSAAPQARWAPTQAGAHGSHCAPDPGFAVWWHEGDAAFNSGAGEDSEGCSLTLDFDEIAMTMDGQFECGPLRPAAHPGQSGEAKPSTTVGVSDGRFHCDVVRMPPPPAN